MKYVYVSELCIPIRLKVVEVEGNVDIVELERKRSRAIEVVEKALKEAGLEFDGVMSSEIKLVPDWLEEEVIL